MPVIYLDVLIAVNWLIDGLLLSAVSRILRQPTKRWRIVLSGLVGAVASGMIFFTALSPWLLILLHAVVAAALIWIAFPFEGIGSLLRQVTVLYMMSALFSGLVTVLWSLTRSETFLARNGVVYWDVSPLWLAVATAVSYGAICLYEYLTRKRTPPSCEATLRIDDGAGICECRALYDTGMRLAEPFSGRPVVLVERDVLDPYLSDELKAALYCPTVAGREQRRIRLVPYRSLGADGLLPAFVPRDMTVTVGRQNKTVSGTYVALCKDLGLTDYQALVGSDTMGGSSG